jgi:hypothetical protein
MKVTSELAMFTVRPQSSLVMIINTEDNTPDESLCDVNIDSNNYEYFFECYDDDFTSKSDNDNEEDDLQYYKYNNTNKKSKLAINNSLYKRAKKSNKRIKIKTLLKKNSLVPQLDFVNKSVTSVYSNDIFKYVDFKSNAKLYIKYNIYRKFIFINENDECRNLFDDFYIKKIDRTINVFARNKIKSIDNLSLKKLIRDNNVIINNSSRKSNEDIKKQKEQLAEKQTLTVFTIDHNRVNDELNQTYDNLYLEFLISIQHRDITPEDYEHLCKNFINIFYFFPL